MNKIKIILLTLIAICSFFSVSFASESTGKIQVDYYWGDGCSHCAEIEPFIDAIEEKYKDEVVINRFEIWKDKNNAFKFNQEMELYRVPQNGRGTPSLIINNKALVGSEEIGKRLEQEINFAIERKEQIEKNNKQELNNLLSPMGTIDVNNPNKSGALLEKDSMRLKAIAMTAIVDSINPCAIMVLIILLSSLIVMQKEKSHIVLTSMAFIVAVYMTYFFIGLGLTNLIAGANVANVVTLIIGVVAVLIGLANLKDAFFYRKGDWAIEIPEAWRNKLTKIIMSATSPLGAFVAGTMVTFIELPCTGGPYLFGLSLIAHSSTLLERVLLLGFYNFIFILPLIIIAILVIKGAMTIERAEKLKNNNVKVMHFITGIVMFILGVWVLYVNLSRLILLG